MPKNLVRTAVILATVVALAAPAYPALAGGGKGKGKGKGAAKTAVTKMDLALDAQELSAGEQLVTGTVGLTYRTGKTWTPVQAATIDVTFDGGPANQIVLEQVEAGVWTFSFTATIMDEHVVKAVFAGDATLKRSQRSQGVTLLPEVPETPPAEGAIAEPTP